MVYGVHSLKCTYGFTGQAVKSPTRHLDSLPALARWKANDDDYHDNGDVDDNDDHDESSDDDDDWDDCDGHLHDNF